ncbi:MAG: PLP-dependent aminotransferase family protein [Candidatus Manganitrophaceae bacterium]
MTIEPPFSYSKRAARIKNSMIRDLLKLTSDPAFISFAGGLPFSDSFPIGPFSDILDRLLRDRPAVLQYSPTEGIAPLREWVAEKYRCDLPGLTADHLLITHGSQQAFDLIGKLFIDEGSEIVIENPSYLGAIQSFNLFGASYRPVGLDADGVRTDELEAALARPGALFFYAMPSFQNPTGSTWTLARRKEAARLLDRHQTLLIEDNPYGELWFDQPPPSSLMALRGLERTLLVISFSKSVAPGLRIGAIIGPKEIIRRLTQIKQSTDLHTNTLGQAVVAEFLASPGYREHLVKLRKQYQTAMEVMATALEKTICPHAVWNRPAGGMFFWCTLKGRFTAHDLLRETLLKKVAFIPGEEFAVAPGLERALRLNYTYASHEKIREGIGLLQTCADRLHFSS